MRRGERDMIMLEERIQELTEEVQEYMVGHSKRGPALGLLFAAITARATLAQATDISY